MQTRRLVYQDSEIHYTTTGIGLPVVLIHGFAEDSTVWKQQAVFFKNDFRLIIPDLPGSGHSTLLKDKAGIPEYAACVKAILDAENIETCVMIGHSMGGYITLAFEARYPGYIRAFGLFHSSAYADDAAKKEMRKKAILSIEKYGGAAFLKTSIPGLFFNVEKMDAEIQQLLHKGNNFSDAALIQYYNSMLERPDRTELLINAGKPVLLILGEHDKAIPLKSGLEQAKMAPVTYLHILQDSSHMGMLEETARSNKILADFLHSL